MRTGSLGLQRAPIVLRSVFRDAKATEDGISLPLQPCHKVFRYAAASRKGRRAGSAHGASIRKP